VHASGWIRTSILRLTIGNLASSARGADEG